MANLDRTSRDSQTREKETRKRPWAPPGAFPMDLNTDPNFRYRWIRTHYNGAEEDKSNLYRRMQAGWRPVKAEEMPDLDLFKSDAGNIAMSGTILCKNSVENTQQVEDYYRRQAEGQLEGAASEFESSQDPRMATKFSEGTLRTRTIRP